ncbi:MAG TPA: hypothetical protein VJ851_17890 [Jatrophihabitans sp.]|nr:hypothetical protein [Jatrophihabitans sp.]
MSREMEDRLRAAYQAKTEQVTDRRLAQLRAERASQLATLLSEDIPIACLEQPPVQLNSRRSRHSRWFAPAVAASAVAAVAAAAFALSQPGPRRVIPAPPASHVSSPTGSATPSVSSSPSASASSSTSGAPAYLPAGQTGARTDVPWGAVGTGWRLVQPTDQNGSLGTLYLYDPAGGRYLISDQLSKQAYLQAWSPDGQRAMLQTSGSDGYSRFQQLDLRSGQLVSSFRQYGGNFLSYTQPRGLAALVTGWVQADQRVLRYGTDGTLQLAYPLTVGGLPLHIYYPILYTADGSQLVAQAGKYSVLLSNGGQFVRQYVLPSPSDQACRPVKWWTSDTFLEACEHSGGNGSATALYLQPAAGGTPALLVDQPSPIGMGYGYGWQLSNGDVLLARMSGCGSAGYDVFHPDRTIVPLRLPAGVPEPGSITDLTGDQATFRVVHGCGNPGSNVSLLGYDMVTGATTTLLHSDGIVRGYPD